MHRSISLFAFLLATASISVAAASSPARISNPDSALALLQEGNARFAAGKSIQGSYAEHRAETATGQSPLAVIVGCADSRTPPELIFDQGIGDLFVIRTAGNLAGAHALGSIEYAVKHLGVRLLVVMGHQSCGAVTAAMTTGNVDGNIRSIVDEIRPAIGTDKDIAGAVRANARNVARRIRDKAELGSHGADVRIVTAYYTLETGILDWELE